MEGHGWSFPITGMTFQMRKVIGDGGGWDGGGLLDYIVSPSPIPFPLDFGFWTWILDPDFGLDLTLAIIQHPMTGRPEQQVEEDRIGYKTSSRLRISNFTSEDAGTYHCVSSNSHGSDQEAIRIYGGWR